MGCESPGVSGSGTAIPLLVRPSNSVEPTAVALRFGERVGLTLDRTSRESTGMTHLVSCKSRAQQKHAESQVLH